MFVNYTKKDEMVQIYSKHEYKDKCSRIDQRLFKLNGQAGGSVMLDICIGIIVFEFTDLINQRTAAIRPETVRFVACLL